LYFLSPAPLELDIVRRAINGGRNNGVDHSSTTMVVDNVENLEVKGYLI